MTCIWQVSSCFMGCVCSATISWSLAAGHLGVYCLIWVNVSPAGKQFSPSKQLPIRLIALLLGLVWTRITPLVGLQVSIHVCGLGDCRNTVRQYLIKLHEVLK